MQKKTINFEDLKKFETELKSYKNALISAASYENLSMYFHIFTTDLQEKTVRPIWETIEKVFPGQPWFGHSTAGNVSDCEITSDLSVSITVFEKPTTKFKLLQYSMEKQSTKEIAAEIIEESKKNSWVKAVEFYRTITSESPTVFCENFDVLPEEVQMFGGIVCSRNITSTDSCVFSSAGGFDPHGLVVLLFGGPDFHVNSFKISGWQPIGRNFEVTKAKGSTIYELDKIPAYNVYKKYLNIENDENLFVNALEFPMMYEHNGVTVVRAPAAGNEDGSLVMSADVEQGSIVRLSYGEPNTIIHAVQKKANKIRDFHADLLHIFYCTARKVFWGIDEPTTEIHPFRYVKGCTGFFSHGEFLREKGNLNQNSMTLVIAAMREGEGSPESGASSFDENSINTKLPLAARMATFIREISFELESRNSQLKQTNKMLQGIAKTDALTGLDNRMSFDNLLSEIENEKESGKDWTMMMIDLNELKNTNDSFGHEAGDTILKAAASIISDVYGKIGSCFRIGGDEFVVVSDFNSIMNNKDKLKEEIAEYNKKQIHKLSMAIGESRLLNEKGIRQSISDWKMEADLNMYRDKEICHKAGAAK